MADVVFPLETHAEKDGTVTHPDGRLQRVRPSAPRAPATSARTGASSPSSRWRSATTPASTSQPSAFAALADAVPFYAGITDADIGGRGIRWQDRPDAAAALPRAGVEIGAAPTSRGSAVFRRGGATGSFRAPARRALTLGTYRDLWAGPITELNPPLRFLAAAAAGRDVGGRRRAARAESRRRGQGRPERDQRPWPRSTSRNGSPRAPCFLIEGSRGRQRQRAAQRRPGRRRRSRRSASDPARRHAVRRSDLDHGRQVARDLRGDLRRSCR